ncbi:unnamed protein product [Rotaria magnacalcarata]|uniref:Uncharacterized protein n=1 Tax=Rotaria magnacalcarata TaxID=392030 RepID=A0A816N9J6_9BILA|nr:unnamed protein product [Rotaria magnacalcarata]CAF1583105.1 unnamed protein product [Rotaria magnacalcarata]CAF2032908.1 unnamed protein product [Rotaria magnacalcarata]CAF2102560.1 unnamed protein product [Rotaria magnacalcarata]CAF3954295.1 unnamed protein product [Rotaria magnacalcarata]
MNNSHDHPHIHHQNVVIGDIFLHLEAKPIIIQVVIQSPLATSPLALDKPVVHRLSTNSSGKTGSQGIVSCDLKNSLPIKGIRERTKSSSTKKLMRVHKASLTLVKELKSKVSGSNQTELKSIVANANVNTEHTYF